MSKQLKTWLERVNAPTISHSHVIQLYNCVYPMSRGARPGGKASNLEPDEAREIMPMIWPAMIGLLPSTMTCTMAPPWLVVPWLKSGGITMAASTVPAISMRSIVS